MKIRKCDIHGIIIDRLIWNEDGIKLETSRARTWIPGFAEPEAVTEEVSEMSTADL